MCEKIVKNYDWSCNEPRKIEIKELIEPVSSKHQIKSNLASNGLKNSSRFDDCYSTFTQR